MLRRPCSSRWDWHAWQLFVACLPPLGTHPPRLEGGAAQGALRGLSKPARACSGRSAGVVREEADGCSTGAGTGRGAGLRCSQRAPSRALLRTSPLTNPHCARGARRGSALGLPSTAHRRRKGTRRPPSRELRNRRVAAGPSVTRCVSIGLACAATPRRQHEGGPVPACRSSSGWRRWKQRLLRSSSAARRRQVGVRP